MPKILNMNIQIGLQQNINTKQAPATGMRATTRLL